MAHLADFRDVRINRTVQILEEYRICRIVHVDYRLEYPASAAGIGVYYDIGNVADDLHAYCLRIRCRKILPPADDHRIGWTAQINNLQPVVACHKPMGT